MHVIFMYSCLPSQLLISYRMPSVSSSGVVVGSPHVIPLLRWCPAVHVLVFSGKQWASFISAKKALLFSLSADFPLPTTDCSTRLIQDNSIMVAQVGDTNTRSLQILDTRGVHMCYCGIHAELIL